MTKKAKPTPRQLHLLQNFVAFLRRISEQDQPERKSEENRAITQSGQPKFIFFTSENRLDPYYGTNFYGGPQKAGLPLLTTLTLRLLMSYIYMEHLFLTFLDHTQRRSTVGRTPLDE